MNSSFNQTSTITAYNSVVHKTYLLLSITLFTTALASFLTATLNLKPINILFEIIVLYGLMFAITYTSRRNEDLALGLLFGFSFFLGYMTTPILDMYIANGMGQLIYIAFGITAADFLVLTAYIFITKKNMDFIVGSLISLFIVVFGLFIVSFFVNLPALAYAVSGLMIVFSSMFILYQTSLLVRGAETNYILATLNLYISLYNIFLSVLELLGAFSGNGRR